ncbi:MAG: membrane protein insertase YidC [Candidatus Tectomicrobia bacterium]|nr:membrane protein insertase YidC [Candidatus Tectomicrobia bacterium]
MEKRAILAAVLSMLVLIGYQIFFVEPQMQARRQAQQEAERKAAQARQETAKKQAVEREAVPRERPRPPSPLPSSPPSAAAPKDIVVDTGVARIVLTTLGAGIKELTLRHYKDAGGEPLNLVAKPKDGKAAAGARRLPLYLDGGESLAERANRAVFSVKPEALTLTPERPEGTLEFLYRSPRGGTVSKTLRFRHGSYAADVTLRWEGSRSSEGLAVLWGPGIASEGHEEDRYATTGPVTYRGGKLVFTDDGDLEGGKAVVQKGGVQWTSLHSKYFMAALIPRAGFDAAVIKREGKDDGVLVGLRFAGGPEGEGKLSLFAGPKDQTILKAYGSSLEEAIDLGWFSFVAKPLLVALRFFHNLTQSYGLAIIILTVLIKVIFYPLTQKSTKSMQEMQKLQPKMKQIREIFKDDRQRMNEEVMKLYREHKVNPLGGCLPMVLQIPVFFALYNVLLGAIELRQASFLWLRDLSAPETGLFTIPGVGVEFRLLVLLMGASMFVQQKMTPMAADPTQQKMMLFMPILFTFLFWAFPAGLVVYWLANNVLSIGQQYFTLRAAKQPAKPPPAKLSARARKTSKAGKG